MATDNTNGSKQSQPGGSTSTKIAAPVGTPKRFADGASTAKALRPLAFILPVLIGLYFVEPLWTKAVEKIGFGWMTAGAALVGYGTLRGFYPDFTKKLHIPLGILLVLGIIYAAVQLITSMDPSGLIADIKDQLRRVGIDVEETEILQYLSQYFGWALICAGLVSYGVLRGFAPVFTKKLTPLITIAFLALGSVYGYNWVQGWERSPQKGLGEAYGDGGTHTLTPEVRCVFEAHKRGQKLSWTLHGKGFFLQSYDRDFAPAAFYIGTRKVGPDPVWISREMSKRTDFRAAQAEGLWQFCGPKDFPIVLKIAKHTR